MTPPAAADGAASARQAPDHDPHHSGIRGTVEAFIDRLRGGDLGSIPVVVGLVIIWAVFQTLNPTFLSSTNLVNLTMQSAAVGTIAIGIVLVLLMGEIDLSVG